MVAKVSRKAGNVNIQYRSERIELDVSNAGGLLSPGMYADVWIDSQGNGNAVTVPKSAVITSTEKMYVLAVRDGKAIKIDVSKGNETAGEVEVMGELQANDTVIANPNEEIADRDVIKQ